jgi:imidazole glycerol-phosphate synthase subunit HisH
MSDEMKIKAAIVDHRLGNLYSVKLACEHVGMQADVTDEAADILSADVVILPGVGAYEDAMIALNESGLSKVLHEVAERGTPLVGVCLGLQLLMTESFEFGHHLGLGLIEGQVLPFDKPQDKSGRILKVPQVCWNRIHQPVSMHWDDSFLAGVDDDEYMYFVHSFYVKPASEDVVLATTSYGDVEFCSSLRRGNIFATQFHPERSGPQGLRVYENIAAYCKSARN